VGAHPKTIAFVAGATGLTGRHVVHALRQRNVETVAHIRPDSGRFDEWKKHFEALGARVSDAAWTASSMSAALDATQPTLLFGLLGTTKKRAKQGGGDYQAIDYGLTRLLIEAAEALTSPPRFIYLSAVGVSSDTRNTYMKARAQVEERLEESRLPSLIARPSFILGNRDDFRLGETIGAPILDGLMGLVSVLGGNQLTGKYRSMSGENLAAALVEMGLNGRDGLVHVPELKHAAAHFKLMCPS